MDEVLDLESARKMRDARRGIEKRQRYASLPFTIDIAGSDVAFEAVVVDKILRIIIVSAPGKPAADPIALRLDLSHWQKLVTTIHTVLEDFNTRHRIP